MTKKEKAILILTSLKTSEEQLAKAYAELKTKDVPFTETEVLVKLWGDSTMPATELSYFLEEHKLSGKFSEWLENEESL